MADTTPPKPDAPDDIIAAVELTEPPRDDPAETVADPPKDENPEPRQVQPRAERPSAPRRTGPGPMMAGGLVAAIAGFALAQFVPDGWPLARFDVLSGQMVEQAEGLASLRRDLDALAADASGTPAPDAALIARIDALEAAQAAALPPPDLSAVETRLQAVEERLARIEALPTAETGSVESMALAAALAALQDEVAALKAAPAVPPSADLSAAADAAAARLAEAETQARAMKDQAEAAARAGRALAAADRILAAIDSGAPFGAALADLDGVAVPEILSSQSQSGVPSLQVLRDGFPEAARAALDAALRADMGESWGERVSSFLRTQTGARSLTPREGDDPDAILSRAEDALRKGDVGAALTEIATLPEVARTAMEGWTNLAAARHEAALAARALADTLAAEAGQ